MGTSRLAAFVAGGWALVAILAAMPGEGGAATRPQLGAGGAADDTCCVDVKLTARWDPKASSGSHLSITFSVPAAYQTTGRVYEGYTLASNGVIQDGVDMPKDFTSDSGTYTIDSFVDAPKRDFYVQLQIEAKNPPPSGFVRSTAALVHVTSSSATPPSAKRPECVKTTIVAKYFAKTRDIWVAWQAPRVIGRYTFTSKQVYYGTALLRGHVDWRKDGGAVGVAGHQVTIPFIPKPHSVTLFVDVEFSMLDNETGQYTTPRSCTHATVVVPRR